MIGYDAARNDAARRTSVAAAIPVSGSGVEAPEEVMTVQDILDKLDYDLPHSASFLKRLCSVSGRSMVVLPTIMPSISRLRAMPTMSSSSVSVTSRTRVFRGALCLFILEMGLAAGERIVGWKVGRVNADGFSEDRLAGPLFRQGVRRALSGLPVPFPVFTGGFAAVEGEFVLRLGREVAPGRSDWTAETARARSPSRAGEYSDAPAEPDRSPFMPDERSDDASRAPARRAPPE